MRILQKTSDRLLAGMVIAAALLTCCIHLALYAQYRHGNIHTVQQILETKFVRYHPPRPSVISLTGTVWVNFYPSDSFYIELPKQKKHGDKPWLTGQVGPEETLPMPRYSESGDTLLVSGSFNDPLHRPFADFGYRNHLPQVNIYCPGSVDIRLRDGQLVLGGTASANGAPAIRLRAVNSTVWVANYNEPNPVPSAKEFFDSLDIHLSNSYMLLNRSAVIRKAGIRLDDQSELNDRWSTTGQLHIGASDDSHIDLTGENLKRSIIDIH